METEATDSFLYFSGLFKTTMVKIYAEFYIKDPDLQLWSVDLAKPKDNVGWICREKSGRTENIYSIENRKGKKLSLVTESLQKGNLIFARRLGVRPLREPEEEFRCEIKQVYLRIV